MIKLKRPPFRYGLKERIFARLDCRFIQGQLLFGAVKERMSWSLGEALQGLATPAHEAFLKASQRLGCSFINSTAVHFALEEIPKEVPHTPSLGLKSKTVSRRARELLQGICRLDDDYCLRMENLTWSPDPFGEVSSTARFNFHCLEWVRELLDAYCATKDLSYLEQAKKLTLLWISQCLFLESHAVVWDDHATAVRLIVICRLWVVCRFAHEEGLEFGRKLISAVLRHGRRLERKRFYRPGHNHGITQAYALMVAGLLFRWLPEAPTWADLGRRRLEQQMSDNVSREGMHREHSPFYHFYVCTQFLFAYQFGAAYGVEYSTAFTERLKMMVLCGSYVIKPNGELSAMGDTCRSSPILLSPDDVTEWFADAGKMFLYSVTAGGKGSQPEVNSVVLPHAGIAVLRSGWGNERPFQDELFAAVRTCTFDSSHIHRDQLSFEIYAYGDDLIVDSGGPYIYGDPVRDYFLSTRAHNTVVVDGQNQEIGKAEIVDWRTSSAFDILILEQCSVPMVVHRRAIIFVRSGYFIIIDLLKGDALHNYAQLFHLCPRLTAQLKGLTISTTRESKGPTIQIIPLIKGGLRADLQTEASDPGNTWVCLGEGKKISTTVVTYQYVASTAEFAVLLVPQPSGVSIPVYARMEDLPGSNGRRISITIGERSDEIFIDRDNQVTVSRLGSG